MARIDSVYDFSDKALVELKSWLEPWFKTKDGCECVPAAPSGDTIDALIESLTPDAWWKLDESSGAVAHDSSGNGLDLTATSPAVPPAWGAAAGPPGAQAADFTPGSGGFGGSAARVTRAWTNTGFAAGSSFTAGLWFKQPASSYTQAMGQGTPARSGGAGGWEIGVWSDYPYFQFTGTPVTSGWFGQFGHAVATLPVNTWAFVAVTYDSTSTLVKLYVNGLLDATSLPFTWSPAGTSKVWIGCDGDNAIVESLSVIESNITGSYAFILNRVLTGAELLNINNTALLPAGANVGKTLIATGLGGTYWDFASSGSGTTAARPTLTANGGALFVGTGYFDTTLGKPIWWNGTVWKDATGTTV